MYTYGEDQFDSRQQFLSYLYNLVESLIYETGIDDSEIEELKRICEVTIDKLKLLKDDYFEVC